MKNLSCIPFAFSCLLLSASCIEEKLDACPPQGGNVAVTLRVERFQTRPPYRPSDLEPEFAERIHSLDYLLYAEGRLIGQGRADDIRAADGNSYLFRLDTLPFGNYRLAFAANAAPHMMAGTTDAPELRYIVYQGEKGADDHFRAALPFEVTCPCRNEFEAVLRRVYGVTRFRFENLPAAIASVEVSLDNVGERMPLCGDPDRPCEVARRIPVTDMAARADGTYTLGTFCTLPGIKCAWCRWDCACFHIRFPRSYCSSDPSGFQCGSDIRFPCFFRQPHIAFLKFPPKSEYWSEAILNRAPDISFPGRYGFSFPAVRHGSARSAFFLFPPTDAEDYSHPAAAGE